VGASRGRKNQEGSGQRPIAKSQEPIARISVEFSLKWPEGLASREG
jgi:hypothetical protein